MHGRVDQFVAAIAAENRSHQIAGLGDHFFACHRIFGGAANGFHGFSETCVPSVERYLDDGYASGQLAFEFGVRDELYFGALLQDRGILHARLVVRSFERRCLVEQHDRDHVLHTNVGHFAIGHQSGFARCDAHGDRLHLVGFERMALEDDFERVERRLDRRADGPFLDVGARDFVALAQLVDQLGMRSACGA